MHIIEHKETEYYHGKLCTTSIAVFDCAAAPIWALLLDAGFDALPISHQVGKSSLPQGPPELSLLELKRRSLV